MQAIDKLSDSIPPYSYSQGGLAIRQNQTGISWDKVIGKEVKSADGKDLGEVESVATDWIEVKKGKLATSSINN